MRTIQMTIDDDLVKAVDRVSKGKIGSLITSFPLGKMVDVGLAIHFALDI